MGTAEQEKVKLRLQLDGAQESLKATMSEKSRLEADAEKEKEQLRSLLDGAQESLKASHAEKTKLETQMKTEVLKLKKDVWKYQTEMVILRSEEELLTTEGPLEPDSNLLKGITTDGEAEASCCA